MNEGEKKPSRMRFIQARLPNDLYEWVRTRGFLTRRSMNSIVLEAIADYRVIVDAKEIAPSKDGVTRDETVKYNVRVDDDMYEWLRTTAFYARISINAIFVSALVHYRDVHPDTTDTPVAEGAGSQGSAAGPSS